MWAQRPGPPATVTAQSGGIQVSPASGCKRPPTLSAVSVPDAESFFPFLFRKAWRCRRRAAAAEAAEWRSRLHCHFRGGRLRPGLRRAAAGRSTESLLAHGKSGFGPGSPPACAALSCNHLAYVGQPPGRGQPAAARIPAARPAGARPCLGSAQAMGPAWPAAGKSQSRRHRPHGRSGRGEKGCSGSRRTCGTPARAQGIGRGWLRSAPRR